MFRASTSDVKGFSSNWLTPTESEDSGCQTEAVTQKEQESQTKSTSSVQIQTDAVLKSPSAPSYDENKLAAFLSKIGPSLLRELDKTEKSKAFSSLVAQSEDVPEAKGLHVIKPPKLQSPIDEMRVSCLSWSCTGNVFAVGYKAAVHGSWCTHECLIQFYNISSSGFDGSSPYKSIPSSSCVTSIAMHQFEPAVVAVGTFNGSVLLLNLAREDDDYEIDNPVMHEDAVSQVCWVDLNSQLHLVSAALDGKIHLFKVSPKVGTIQLLDRYSFFNGLPSQLEPGLMCFDFSPDKLGVFVVGLEGGSLIHCSTVAAIPRPGGEESFSDPTVKILPKLSGSPVSIRFSPFNPSLFAVATQENKVYLHSLKESGPVRTLYAPWDVSGLMWSPSQADVLFSYGTSSNVLVFNVRGGNTIASLGVDQQIRPDSRDFITSAALNLKSGKLVVLGTSSGNTCVWEVPQFFNVI